MKRLSHSWSHPVVLNTGTLDWESSALTTRPLLLCSKSCFMSCNKLGILFCLWTYSCTTSYLPVMSLKVFCVSLPVPIFFMPRSASVILIWSFTFSDKSDCDKINVVLSVIIIIAILIKLLQILWGYITSFMVASENTSIGWVCQVMPLVQSDFSVFDHQYFQKESVDIVGFLHGDSQEGKIVSETITLGWFVLAMSASCPISLPDSLINNISGRNQFITNIFAWRYSSREGSKLHCYI